MHERGLAAMSPRTRAAWEEFKRLEALDKAEGYQPGTDCTYGAEDGLNYTIPAEKMPNAEKWASMVRQDNMGGPESPLQFSVSVPKKMRDQALQKKLSGCKVVVVKKTKFNERLGLVLANDTGPVDIMGVNEAGLCFGEINVGEQLIAINGELTDGHELTSQMLKKSLGTVTLHVKTMEPAFGDAAAKRKPKGVAWP